MFPPTEHRVVLRFRSVGLLSRRRRRQNELHPRVRTTVARFRLDVDVERLVRFEIQGRLGSAALRAATATRTAVVRLLVFPPLSVLGSDGIRFRIGS